MADMPSAFYRRACERVAAEQQREAAYCHAMVVSCLDRNKPNFAVQWQKRAAHHAAEARKNLFAII